MLKIFPVLEFDACKITLRPIIRENPDHIILNVGTNDLTTNIPTEKVAESIRFSDLVKVELCRSVTISYLTMRNNRYWKKEAHINGHLKTLCIEREILN